jgi:hypothetical protein
MELGEAQVLGVVAKLERACPAGEVDELSLAVALGIVARSAPPHNYTMSPLRVPLLRVLTTLEHRKLIYATTGGFWRMHLTAAGRAWLAAQGAAAAGSGDRPLGLPPSSQTPWQAPRPARLHLEARPERFTSIALGVALFGAFLIFILSNVPRGPLAQPVAAKPAATVGLPGNTIPTAAPATAMPTTAPAPPPAAAAAGPTYIVANTGGVGVYLRRSPALADRLNAYPDNTPLQQIGPDTTAGGLTWHHVRAPDGTEGYVPAQYTAPAQ